MRCEEANWLLPKFVACVPHRMWDQMRERVLGYYLFRRKKQKKQNSIVGKWQWPWTYS